MSDHDEQNRFLQGDDDMIEDEESDAVCQL